MQIELLPKAEKYYLKLDKDIRNRFDVAFDKLSEEPPVGDIKSMTGKDGFRLRIGKYRVLFDIIDNKIIVHEIGLRGQIYKKRG